ncbi:type VI secretion system Vgr family protein [Hymenobacter sp. H14-R3]|uniref:type VI secretion system Vgr family protein n=1 Tax=Hymenobacter sp. H14-R3 TaxID=3046308 RepID=UPI0024BAAFF6|nr:type VI secretion system Vgr family protein [Hymenobacter sp. H14-R3]MDJ0364703.1 type VI secretion system Vgr family protein [Hymenobacter sp. H14-R3]
MSYPVKVSVQVAGVADPSSALADYHHLTLQQHALTHHTFTLDFACDTLGKALGIKPELVPIQAHTRLSGKDITIGWTSRLASAAGRSFQFKGIITDICIRTDADLVNYYHLSGYSPTFLLEDGTQSRTFVKKSLPTIFDQVLAAYPGNAFARQLSAQGSQVLPYVVQYQETNFHFLSRLAAAQGEWFYYDGTTLRLGGEQAPLIAFRSSGAQVFSLAMRLQPSTTQGAAYNYRTHAPLAATAAAPAAGYALSQFAVQHSAALFTQPQRLVVGPQGRDQAQLQRALDGLAARQAGSQVTLTGQGEAFDTRPGSVLDVQDAAGASYGKFRVLSVVHTLDGDGNYQNRFEALPEGATGPPPNPYCAPPGAQPELAQVLDLADPKQLGRVRVRYYWGVAQASEAESGWLRVSTPYAGDGKGQLFTPEVGSQVLVGYEQGRAEFPVVLGNLFHARNPAGAKYSHGPGGGEVKGIQTLAGNRLTFHDKKGEEKIVITSGQQKETVLEISFKGQGRIEIKTAGDISLRAGQNVRIEAGKKMSLKADELTLEAKTIQAKADSTVEVGAAGAQLKMAGASTQIKGTLTQG